MRYYVGVDWADASHVVVTMDEQGETVQEETIRQTVDAFSAWGHQLDTWRAREVELWAAIERPDGRVVDFLLDHGVTVFPVNPKALDRARDRFRASGAKSDPFDARVLADFLRTDHRSLHALQPSSADAQELKLLTEDHQRLGRHQTRLLNQLTATLKVYYPLPLELWGDLTTQVARAFLHAYPTPAAAGGLRRNQWARFARAHRLSAERAEALWQQLHGVPLPVPAHVVRAKTRLMHSLLAQLDTLVPELVSYQEAIETFFAALPAAQWARTLPASGSGTTVPMIWARLGDAPGRWRSAQHLQAQAGTVPVTSRSGQQRLVHFRYACDKQLRHTIEQFAWLSIRSSAWAAAYYRQQRARGHHHRRALRALAAKWLKILFVLWAHQRSYDEQHHLATIGRQHLQLSAAR